MIWNFMSGAAHDPLYSSSAAAKATCGTDFQLKADCKKTIVVKLSPLYADHAAHF
jgi:hypothetical protein